MADSKISALTALAAADVASASDLLAIVDTSAVATKSISVQALHGAAQVVQTKTPAVNTTYTLSAATDAGTVWVIDSTFNATIQVTSAAGFVQGQRLDVVRLGNGSVNFTAGTGATLVSTPGTFLRTRYSAASLLVVSVGATTAFIAIGDLTA